MNISGIYKIICTVNNKFYLGSSKNIKSRWYEHKCSLKKGIHHSIHLQKAWDKYGKENFRFEILEFTGLEKEILLEREQYWLDTLKPYEKEIGYNICDKADCPIPKETKDRDKEQKFIRLEEIILRYGSMDNLPFGKNLNNQEKSDSYWISDLRKAKKGKGRHIWYPELDEIATKKGFQGMFDTIDVKRNATRIQKFKDIIQKYKTIENFYLSASKSEKKWISELKTGMKKSKNKTYSLYPKLIDIAEVNSWNNFFEVRKINYEKIEIDKLLEIINKYQTLKNFFNTATKRDKGWFVSKRNSKFYGDKNKSKWYPVLDEIASKYEFNNFFDIFEENGQYIMKTKIVI